MSLFRSSNGLGNASMIAVAIPLISVIAAVAYGNLLFLDYVHVLLGAVWIGVDVFFGIIFRFVFRGVSSSTREAVARRMLPATLFFLPAASILTPLAGYALALQEGVWDTGSGVILAMIGIGSVLVISGFLTIFLQSLRIAQSPTGTTDDQKLLRRFSIICNGALLQLALQVCTVSLMAELVVYG